MKLVVITLLSSFLLFGCQSGQMPNHVESVKESSVKAMLIDGIDPNLSAVEFSTLCDSTIQKAKLDFAELESSGSPANMKNVVGAYDDIFYDLQVVRHSWYMKSVHPDESIRDSATKCSESYSDLVTQFSLSKAYYERIAAIDTTALSEKDRYLVEQALTSFRLAGVDKEEPTRNRIRSLNQEITSLGNQFNQNIRNDVRHVTTTLGSLKGLPQDYIDAREVDENGLIRISTDYPDLYPIMTYAESDGLRKEMRIASRSRGYPANKKLLKQLIEKRHQLAQLLGYKNFAALSMKDKMIGTPDNAQAFLSEVGEALKVPVEKELQLLLSRLHKIKPSAERVEVWQANYLRNLVRQEDYALDSKEVRQYFTYHKVRDGIFGLTEDLFGVEIRPWPTETWHSDVESYEMVENGEVIGRFYMDNHPRENKFKHAAHWTLRSGVKNRQIPLSGLAQNFPKGLMEHGQVETFLHEFGHLIHNMFSGTQDYLSTTGMSMERDFVEAPSQMLEEWIWDYETLITFASDKQGVTIPKELVDKMNRARDFGLATSTATQIFYANLSLNYYNQDPSNFKLDEVMLSLQDQYAPYPHVEGTHFYANFGHLNGYSSNYYTYQWSLAIATDLFSVFEQAGMRNKDVAKQYREKVLGAAGSKPAKDFVADFLGRKFTPAAYIKKLNSL